MHALGLGVTGTFGVPHITTSGALVPGQRVTVRLENARPNALAHLVVGYARIDTPFAGGVFYPAPNELYLNLRTGPGGKASRQFSVPDDMPKNSAFYVQWWIRDPMAPKGFAASPALLIVTP